MAHRDLVVIGASAGGIDALQTLLAGLPPDFEATLLIVLHTSRHAGAVLPRILERAGTLPAQYPEDWEAMRRGRIYIAPPDFHLIVEKQVLRVVQGPRENLHRPAIDPLFRSAAHWHGPKVIAVVLSGLLDDGTAGSMVVRAHGGPVLVQDPQSAMFPSMPASVLRQIPDAEAVPLTEIAGRLIALVGEETLSAPAGELKDRRTAEELKVTELDMSDVEEENRYGGHPSVFACPDCGGVLWELEEGGFLRFRCRVGHAFTARNLGSEQQHSVETALWEALRALEESASLYSRMAERAEEGNHNSAGKRFEERVSDITRHAQTLRNFLTGVHRDYDEEEWGALEER